MSKIENLAQLLRDVAARTGWGPEMLERIEAAHEMLSRFTPAPIQYGDADVYLGVGLAQFKKHGSDSWVYGEAYVNQGGALFVRDAEGMAAAFKRLDMALAAAPTSHDNWRQYATESEATAQAIIERHRRELQHVLRQYGEQTERQPRTDAEIIAQTENLAAKLLDWRWDGILESGSFRDSKNPRAASCWAMACSAQELLTDTDPENAAAEIDGAAGEGGAA